MTHHDRPLAVVTGASTGIGFELARLAAENGYDLVIAADEPEIFEAAASLRSSGAKIDAVQADLSTIEGNDELLAATLGRPVSALFANAGRGLGRGFLDQDFEKLRRVVDTNVTGTLYLVHSIGRQMRAAGEGRILITGSIAGYIPGTYQAVYNGTKALIDSFAIALRAELMDTGVSVTCLMPGPTDTEFFKRAELLDTKLGQDAKQPPAEVAKIGFDAMLRRDADVVAGWKNKIQAAVAHVVPSTLLAEAHRTQAVPGGAKHQPTGI